jgi:AhpD family alkylhydroperoxidase
VNKTLVVLAVGFVVAVLAVLVVTTMGTNRYRCEVCISFHDRSACRTAGASSEAQALRAATENACAQIASGVTDSMACENTPPQSVKWLSGK